MRSRVIYSWFFIPAVCGVCLAQTTQSVMEGRVTDLRNGQPVPGCAVKVAFRADGMTRERVTDAAGTYVFSPLSPGAYDLSIECPDYQRQESHNVQLEVASLALINVRVRALSEVWEDNYRRLMLLPDSAILTLYGPDLDLSHTSVVQPLRGSPSALEATVSQTIGSQLLKDLPLSGRDAYSLLVLQPGVTSDSGIDRSLALSVNGQRASASKFLLDGIENDNPLVTGPLSPIAPEALAEYRISSNSFSAEYGRASGYVANAITRAGTLDFHGTGYFYAQNEKLMARTAAVAGADPSAPFRELQPGLVLTGPIRKRWNLLGSVSWESARVYTRQPGQQFTVPTKSWIDGLKPESLASQWLRPYETSAPNVPGATYTYLLAPALRVNRQTIVPRSDWTSPDGTQHVSARYAGFFVDRPKFRYSPWPGFSEDLSDTTHSTAISWSTLPHHSRFANELRFGFSVDSFSALRPHPEVPDLIVADATAPQGMNLPSAQNANSFSNRTRFLEFDDDVSYQTSKHIVRAGGGLISRRISGVLSSYSAPQFAFNDLSAFAADAPGSIILSLARNNPLTSPLPDFNRSYSVFDWYGFVQDSFRPIQRLTLSTGLRYDWFGSPAITGATGDYLLQMLSTGDVSARLAAATLLPASNSAHLYDIRHNGLAFRGGLSYSLDRNAATVIRGAFGSYMDRPFDNIWQTIRYNDYATLLTGLDGSSRNYTDLPTLLRSLPASSVRPSFNDLTTFSHDFATPRVMSWTTGIQHTFTERLLIEGDYLGSSSGSLVTTDRLNRQYSVPSVAGNPGGRFVASLPDVVYRANQGRSDYSAASFLLRYRSPRLIAALSYTLSRANDTQSDPVSGEFFDLGFGGDGLSPKATFIRQGDPSPDWGHADFDRRHNFVAMASWMLPGFLEGFQFSIMGAARSGSPFTVTGISTAVSALLDNPADLVPGVPIWANGNAAGDGVQLLNRSAFVAVADHVGNSGRNQLYGPGLWGADASVSRRFRLPRFPERTRLYLRMDVYNAFNHANLGNPDSNLADATFGVATRGPQPTPNAFRIFAPLASSRRQIQMMVKFEF